MAEKTAEQLAAEEAALQGQVDEAADKAKKEAESKGLSQEEVNAAVERARTEEKNKLYPQIEALKEGMKEIQEALRAEREEKEAMKKAAEEEAERQRQSKLSDNERQTELLKRIEEQLREEREARGALEAKLDEENRKRTLETYKQTAIQAAGEEIIPELVTGNTEAEIDASIIRAKARYVELAERFKAEAGDKFKKNMPRSSNPNTEALEEEELNEQLTAVDHDKYLADPAYRRKIQDELANAYAKAQGR